MSTNSHYMYSLTCDGCEETYEPSWAGIYFEWETEARSTATGDGWSYDGISDWCHTCKVLRHPYNGDDDQICRRCGVHVNEHERRSDLPPVVVLPGQLDLFAAVA